MPIKLEGILTFQKLFAGPQILKWTTLKVLQERPGGEEPHKNLIYFRTWEDDGSSLVIEVGFNLEAYLKNTCSICFYFGQGHVFLTQKNQSTNINCRKINNWLHEINDGFRMTTALVLLSKSGESTSWWPWRSRMGKMMRV